MRTVVAGRGIRTVLRVNWSTPNPLQRNPHTPHPGDTPPSRTFTIASLVRQAGVDAWRVAKSIWWAISLPWVAFTATALGAGRHISGDLALREARGVLDDFSASTAEGATNADIEMLFEQLRSIEYGGLIAKVLAWSVPLLLGYLLAVGYTTALVGVETRRLRAGATGTRSDSLRHAAGRTPAMVAAYLYCYVLPFLGVGGVLAGVVFAKAGAVVALIAVAGMAGSVWWIVRNSLVGVAVGTRAGFTKPVREANQAVRGRWWAVLGRLLVVAAVVGIAGMLVSGIVEIGAVGGAGGMLVLWAVARLLSSLIGTTYTVAFQLSMLEALEAEKAGR